MVFQVVAGTHGAAAAAGEEDAEEFRVIGLDFAVDFFQGGAGHVVMPHDVAHFFELVKNKGFRAGRADFFDFRKDLIHVALTAGGRDGFIGNTQQPIVALFTHLLGQNRDGFHAEQF